MNFNHDGSIAILNNGNITSFLTTERFTRKKKHPGVTEEVYFEALKISNINPEDIDLYYILNYESMDCGEIPLVHGTNLKETWLEFELKDIDDRNFHNQQEGNIIIYGTTKKCIVNPPHHLLHAAVAYYYSPFHSSMAIGWDSLMEHYFYGIGNKLHPIEHQQQHTGTIYSAVSARMHLGGIFGAGKLMGLAPYGTHDDVVVKGKIKELSLIIHDTISPNWYQVQKPRDTQYDKLIEISNTQEQVYVDNKQGRPKLNATLAYNTQVLFEYLLDNHLTTLYNKSLELNVEPHICMGGGSSLNSVGNQVCFGRSNFKDIYLHPACSDDGTSLGAVLYHWHHVMNNPKIDRSIQSVMYSTKYYNPEEIIRALSNNANHIRYYYPSDFEKHVAECIAKGEVVAFFQGSGENGPRALGNRSILADPRSHTIASKINLQVKNREPFRPFAPTVLSEYEDQFFSSGNSPFMLRVCKVLRDDIPAVTHYDKSARIQSLKREYNPMYYDIIKNFYDITGIPLVLNTSFNSDLEPIVESPQDAVRALINMNIDKLAFPGIIVQRR